MRNLFLIFFLVVSGSVFSQEYGILSGNVTDLSMYNEPLSFAEVSLKNTKRATRTNFNGNFEFTELAPGTYTLVVGFLGYEPMEVPVEVKANGVTMISQGLEAKTIAFESATVSSVLPSAVDEGEMFAEKSPRK
ncbi:MAG: carboxypeptidase-like regulatory domain-containing protein [Flavobacteriales bacterium]|nr:MAG: carboxypeptidase-like regulatory domain-containing protein [Flavobacteriales bacterium]